MPGCGCEMQAQNDQERKTLLVVLIINALMFVFEFAMGLLAQSSGLLADSLDMLADASVYALSFYAVAKTAVLKQRAARLSGYLQIGLALLVVIDAVRRFMFGSEPVSGLIMAVSVVALVANTSCLILISKHRDAGIHMRASIIFSANDVIANIGVILSGLLVWLLDSRYPDLLTGLLIAAVVLRGGIRIVRESKAEQILSQGSPCEDR